MSKTPKTLYAQADLVGGAVDWSLDDKFPVKKNAKKTINFPKNSGEYDVTVQLTDNTGRGIIFKQADPIWVQEGGFCPPSPGVNSTEIDSIVPGANTLQFTNHNAVDCTLVYQLNFVDAGGADVSPQLDPELKNGGSGGRGLTTAAKVAIIAGVTALVVVLAVTSMGEVGQ